MKKYLLLFSLFILASTLCLAQAKIEEKVIKFVPGAYSSEESGTLQGAQIIDFVLGASKGQQMTVNLDTEHKALYFNVMLPGSMEEAIYVGSIDGNQFSGKLTENGNYRVRLYLMRSAARRKEKADYTISFSITNN